VRKRDACGRGWRRANNGQRSPRKLLRAVIARLLAALPRPSADSPSAQGRPSGARWGRSDRSASPLCKGRRAGRSRARVITLARLRGTVGDDIGKSKGGMRPHLPRGPCLLPSSPSSEERRDGEQEPGLVPNLDLGSARILHSGHANPAITSRVYAHLDSEVQGTRMRDALEARFGGDAVVTREGKEGGDTGTVPAPTSSPCAPKLPSVA
jgi:hypothetical protein